MPSTVCVHSNPKQIVAFFDELCGSPHRQGREPGKPFRRCHARLSVQLQLSGSQRIIGARAPSRQSLQDVRRSARFPASRRHFDRRRFRELPLEGRRLAQAEPAKIHPRYVERVRTVPYRANTLVLFSNSPAAIHGVTPRSVTQAPRRYMNFLGECYRGKSSEYFYAGDRPIPSFWPTMRRLSKRLTAGAPRRLPDRAPDA